MGTYNSCQIGTIFVPQLLLALKQCYSYFYFNYFDGSLGEPKNSTKVHLYSFYVETIFSHETLFVQIKSQTNK